MKDVRLAAASGLPLVLFGGVVEGAPDQRNIEIRAIDFPLGDQIFKSFVDRRFILSFGRSCIDLSESHAPYLSRLRLAKHHDMNLARYEFIMTQQAYLLQRKASVRLDQARNRER